MCQDARRLYLSVKCNTHQQVEKQVRRYRAKQCPRSAVPEDAGKTTPSVTPQTAIASADNSTAPQLPVRSEKPTSSCRPRRSPLIDQPPGNLQLQTMPAELLSSKYEKGLHGRKLEEVKQAKIKQQVEDLVFSEETENFCQSLQEKQQSMKDFWLEQMVRNFT